METKATVTTRRTKLHHDARRRKRLISNRPVVGRTDLASRSEPRN